jgi:hypothetical protein
LPLGVALNGHDEVVSLLAALGATVDVSINPPYSPMTLLEWLSAMLKKLRNPVVRARRACGSLQCGLRCLDSAASVRRINVETLHITGCMHAV